MGRLGLAKRLGLENVLGIEGAKFIRGVAKDRGATKDGALRVILGALYTGWEERMTRRYSAPTGVTAPKINHKLAAKPQTFSAQRAKPHRSFLHLLPR